MANITLNLNAFKASGVYTVEIDATESIVLNTQTIRLVVGFSKTGPFNVPVFLKDKKSAKIVFGDIDRSLEKRGSFFHRSLLTALETGPVYALNLLSLDNTPNGDKIDYKSFSLDTVEDNSVKNTELLSSFYNKERFWKVDDESFQAIVDLHPNTNGKLLSFTNVSQTPISIFVKKSDIKGFDLTIRSFYGSENDSNVPPAFAREFDYVSDYFLDVFIVKGDWTNFNQLSTDPDFSNYFDERGLKIDQFDGFLAHASVKTIGTFQGSIIPNFTDKNGVNHSLDTIINNAVGTTGVFVSINHNALDMYENASSKIDLIGHNLINTDRTYIDMLSYTSPIAEELIYAKPTLISDDATVYVAQTSDFPVGKSIENLNVSFGLSSGYFKNTISIPKPLPTADGLTLDDYDYILTNLNESSLIKTMSGNVNTSYVKVEQVVNTGQSLEIQISHPLKDSDGVSNAVNPVYDNSTPGSNTITVDGDFSDVTEIFHSTFGTYLTINSATYDGVTSTTEFLLVENLTGVVGECLLFDPTSAELVPEITAGLPLDIIFNSSYIEEVEISSGGTVIDQYILAYPGSSLAKDAKNNVIINSDILIDAAGNPDVYLGVSEIINDFGQSCFAIREYMSDSLTTPALDGDFISFGDMFLKDGNPASSNEFVVQSTYGNIEKQVDFIPNTMSSNRLEFKIADDDNYDIEIGQFLVTNNTPENPSHLTTVVSKIKSFNQLTGETEYIIKTNEPVSYINGQVRRFLPIQDFAERLQPTSLNGFKIREYHLPSTAQQQTKILNVINETNIGVTLKDKNVIQFRYIVDTMEGIIAPNMGAKTILSKLAKDRGTCLAFINAPSVKQFTSSVDPRFTELPNPSNGNPRPVFNTEYVASGGNLSLGPSFRFSLPTDELGSTYAGVFFPNILLREFNRNISVPPAADASNNFILKFINGYPFKIAAGEKRGVISNPLLAGVEYELLTVDRENLEPFGLNLLVPSKKVGTMIYSNNLAYQDTLSAFNNLHIRDLLITIEDNIEQILSSYVWEINDAPTRLEIKSLVDRYLNTVKNAGGIYDFLTIMNEKNNTPDIIGQKFGIIDVGVEPAYGLQKVINRISILKPNTISSGGFTIA